VHFDDLMAAGSMAAAKAAGKVRMEGKDYVMHDGDVVEFRFGGTSRSKGQVRLCRSVCYRESGLKDVRWAVELAASPRCCGHRWSAWRGDRVLKSVAISSNVAHRMPSWLLMYSISRSCISNTCGRPETSGCTVIVNTP